MREGKRFFLATAWLVVIGVSITSAGERTKTIDNKVSRQFPRGANSYEEVDENWVQVEYQTRPIGRDLLENKKDSSHVGNRRDVRVVWNLSPNPPSEKLHDWFGQTPFGHRVWVQIIGQFKATSTASGTSQGVTPPEWESWSVDVDLDADSNNNGHIDSDGDNNTAAEDQIEDKREGTIVCSSGDLILRQILPRLPDGSSGSLVIHRSENDKLDIRRKSNPTNPQFDHSIYSGPKESDSENLLDLVKDADLPLQIIAQKRGNLNLEARLDVEVAFPARHQYVEFRDIVRVTIPAVLDLCMDGVSEADEEEPGGYVPINGDNDNGSAWMPDTNNHIPTKRDFDVAPIASENDLVGCTITAPDLVGGTLRLSGGATGRARFKLWEEPNKEHEITLPRDNPPLRFYVEGTLEGDAERECELVIELIRGNKTTCSDKVKFTVTPVLQALSAESQETTLSIDKEHSGYAIYTEGGTREACVLSAKAVTAGCRSARNSGLEFSQTLGFNNTLHNGVGALRNGTVPLRWNYLEGDRRIDGNSNQEVPSYRTTTGFSRTQDGRSEEISDGDSPALPVGPGSRGNATPRPNSASDIGVTYQFALHLAFQFDDGSYYFFGRTTWEVRFVGRITQGEVLADPVFTSGAGAGVVSSAEYVRANELPNPVTTPVYRDPRNALRWRNVTGGGL